MSASKIPTRMLDNKRRVALLVSLAILCSLLLALGIALTRRPWCDEAWFSSPAYTLIHKGFLGTTILDPRGFPFAPLLEGIDRYTYWVPPAYFLLEAAWFKIFGFGLLAMRSISMFWAVVALGAWFAIVRRMTGRMGVALVTVVLLGIDGNFAKSAATGRMDMMCAALEFLGLALYLRWRERNYSYAVWAANCSMAAAALTHPNGVMGIAALALLAVMLDRDKLSWKRILQAAVPYLAGAFLWSLYIFRAPGVFLAQYQAQSKVLDRIGIPWNLPAAIWKEIVERWTPAFELGKPLPAGLLSIPFYVYLIVLAAVIAVPSLRRNQPVRALWALAVLHLCFLLVLQKSSYYLIYAIPFLTALVAVFLHWCASRGKAARWLAAAYIAGAVLIQAASVGARIRHNPRVYRYEPAVAFLKERLRPDDRVIGSGELAFGLGFDGQVSDDTRLGYLSGLRPRFIVLEAQYRDYWLYVFSTREPKTFAYAKRILTNDYRLVYDQSRQNFPSDGFYDRPYQIYERIEDLDQPRVK